MTATHPYPPAQSPVAEHAEQTPPRVAASGPNTTAGQGNTLEITVVGYPTPQGSKKAWVQNGHARMTESSGDRLRSWRQDVKAAAIAVRPATPISGPVHVTHVFAFPRPKSHYGTGRNASVLKASAPQFPASRATGDIEKLVRATHDPLTAAAVWTDDSVVVGLAVLKVYADGGADTGDWIRITPLSAPAQPHVAGADAAATTEVPPEPVVAAAPPTPTEAGLF